MDRSLPDWVKPGAEVVLLREGTQTNSIHRTTISRVLKTKVETTSGETFTTRDFPHGRGGVFRRREGGTWSVNSTLMGPVDHPEMVGPVRSVTLVIAKSRVRSAHDKAMRDDSPENIAALATAVSAWVKIREESR